jgi:hypothetical protein
MLEPHQRAALIPNEAGQIWHHFLKGRFIGKFPRAGRDMSLAIMVQSIGQQDQIHASLHGLVELYSGESLPVVAEFRGELNLETREMALQQLQPDRHYTGQISENGRVIVIRETGEAKPVNLVHEETLGQLM